ncbi:MAG: hypothetical protein JSW48_13480 [Betaproteobacteria bacterium]|jgi:hypothetical protein|nr:MAG: hypothetical protein JSW48_13480 [Betaproteobacteria bacterium]
MKRFLTIVGIVVALVSGSNVGAQNEPGVVFTEEIETVVTVRGVHHLNRTVTVEDPDGERVTIKVPEESQNLYQIQPGDKFRVRFAQAVAVGLLGPGEEPSAGVGEAMRLAPKGSTPGGVMVRVTQISGKIVDIDYPNRIVLVRGPTGNLREFVVSEMVQRFDQLQVGDVVGLQVTEALAMEMIKE